MKNKIKGGNPLNDNNKRKIIVFNLLNFKIYNKRLFNEKLLNLFLNWSKIKKFKIINVAKYIKI